MKRSDPKALKLYRKLIRDAWLPVVGRRKLTSYEYEYTQELFESSIEIETVLKAIKKCADRAKWSGTPIFSIGVIKGDLEAVMQEKSRTHVGATTPVDENAWREQWRRDLTDLISLVEEPFLGAYKSLLADIDSLSREDAQSRWRAIQTLEKE
jgi:hypothetical protein